MIRIDRILCPIDVSDFSRHALHHAIAIPYWYDSTITQGRGALDAFLYGSTAQRVVRRATCPVLTLRAAGD